MTTNLHKISPELFLFERFSARLGFSQLDAVTPDWKKFTSKVTPVGYCDASRLKVRPRSTGFAVLVRDNETNEVFWFHCNTLPEHA